MPALAQPRCQLPQKLGAVIENTQVADLAPLAAFTDSPAHGGRVHIQPDVDDIIHQARLPCMRLCAGHPAQPSIFCMPRGGPPITQRTSGLRAYQTAPPKSFFSACPPLGAGTPSIDFWILPPLPVPGTNSGIPFSVRILRAQVDFVPANAGFALPAPLALGANQFAILLTIEVCFMCGLLIEIPVRAKPTATRKDGSPLLATPRKSRTSSARGSRSGQWATRSRLRTTTAGATSACTSIASW